METGPNLGSHQRIERCEGALFGRLVSLRTRVERALQLFIRQFLSAALCIEATGQLYPEKLSEDIRAEGNDSNLRGLSPIAHPPARPPPKTTKTFGETLGNLPDRLGEARGTHHEDAVLCVGVLLYPPLLLQVPSYRPEVLRVDHVRPLHHPFLGHVHSRPSVGFHSGCLQDPTRRLPRTCPALLLVHEKTRRWWVAVTIVR